MRTTVLRSLHCESCSVTTGWNRENGRRSGSNGYGLSHTTFEEIPPIHLDGLYEKDELYRVWLQFFGEVLPEEYR